MSEQNEDDTQRWRIKISRDNGEHFDEICTCSDGNATGEVIRSMLNNWREPPNEIRIERFPPCNWNAKAV